MAMELAEKHDAVLDDRGPKFDPDSMSVKQLWWFCAQAASSGFFPADIKTPGQALAIVAAGRELGLGVMQSLRGLHIIKGRVTLSASTQLGLLIKAGIKHRWIETSDKAAEIELSRPGAEPFKLRFTIEQAQRAGLTGDNWKKYPDAMLRARAISAAGRAFAPDVLDGVYDPEEFGAQTTPHVEVHEEKKTRTAAVKERLANGGATVTVEPPPAPPVDSTPQH